MTIHELRDYIAGRPVVHVMEPDGFVRWVPAEDFRASNHPPGTRLFATFEQLLWAVYEYARKEQRHAA